MNNDPEIVDQILNSVPYPTDQSKLVKVAEQMGANEQIVRSLQRLPVKCSTRRRKSKARLACTESRSTWLQKAATHRGAAFCNQDFSV